MTSDRDTCGCNGVRACTLCEARHGRRAGQRLNVSRIRRVFVFCPKCRLCVEVDPVSGQQRSSLIKLPGIEVVEEAISEQDESFLVECVEKAPWNESQSGRRKQDFGPKVNFKKQRVKCDAFRGFPPYMDTVMRSFSTLDVDSMRNFEPVELCNLKYSPERGSCIDPHFDDWWLWGERLVTLNLRGATVLTFSRAQDFNDLTQPYAESEGTDENGSEPRYALTSDLIQEASRSHCCTRQMSAEHLQEARKNYGEDFPDLPNRGPSAKQTQDAFSNCQIVPDDNEMMNSCLEESGLDNLRGQAGDVVHVALPRRSVVLVAKEARFKWHHSVLREHVREIRLAMTVRELSHTFLDPQNELEFALGRQLLERSKINPDL